MTFSHTPVLLSECLESLHIREDGVYVDGTVGGAGHSSEILKRLSAKGRLFGIDRDEEALAAAGARLQSVEEEMPLEDRPAWKLFRGNFAEMRSLLAGEGIDTADGILLDLGVSSHQLDTPERGFSYMQDAPLDMRMDQSAGLTAAEVVNRYSEAELIRILRDYGEERFAALIARRIVLERQKKPVETTGELVRILEQAIPAKYRKTGGHPAKRTFQAIRIEVNGELRVLEEPLNDMFSLLRPGGRLCVITFHSLEDRLVTNAMKTAESPCICPPDFPVCVCGRKSLGRVISRKPITASEEELKENTRAASAKLRVFERR